MIRFKILMDKFINNTIESTVVSSDIPSEDLDRKIREYAKSATSEQTFRWEPDFA